MGKTLEEMTLAELWQLFPILLEEHQAQWRDWYMEERECLLQVIPALKTAQIHHVGSTAVGGIWAKPIVDILVELPLKGNMTDIGNQFVKNGYRLMSKEEGRLSLNKGYTEMGFAERVFHLHLRFKGDCNELYFRDYLNENPAVANAYEALKMTLWKQHEHDRDGYTDAKGAFVTAHTEKAKQLYAGRY